MIPKNNVTDRALKNAAKLAEALNSDIFLYSGEISRSYDHAFIDLIDESKRKANALLFLVTNGGDPDAGYKIARHLQYKYETYTVVISGLCKSAGTLIAVGADQLAFSPYGELGPLDIQTIKTDDLAERLSGLSIQEALDSLARSALAKHGAVFSTIIRETGAVVSFPTAAKAASDLVTGLFAPIFARIDPYDVGEKARAMRIATEYGKRLAARTGNLKPKTLEMLTRTYPSHSFVIDMTEAVELFINVRVVSDEEALIAADLGILARYESGTQPTMAYLSQELEIKDERVEVKAATSKRGKGDVAENLRRTKQKTDTAASHNGSK